MKKKSENFWHIRKVGPGTQVFWQGARPEIRHRTHRRNSGPESRDPDVGTQDLRPLSHTLHATRDPRSKTMEEGHRTLMIAETRDAKQTSPVEPGTQELRFKWI